MDNKLILFSLFAANACAMHNADIPLALATNHKSGIAQHKNFESKQNLNRHDHDGNTPLIIATIHGREEVVESLLANDVNVDATNNFGMTALHFAMLLGLKSIAAKLIAKKACLDIKDKFGRTPKTIAKTKREMYLLCKQNRSKRDLLYKVLIYHS